MIRGISALSFAMMGAGRGDQRVSVRCHEIDALLPERRHFGNGDGLKGYTASTVNDERGDYTLTFDERGTQKSCTPAR
jgi:hypothetical protein